MIQKFKMAPSTGSCRTKITNWCLLFVCVLLVCFSITFGAATYPKELSLSLPNDTPKGHVVLSDIHKECVEIFHLQKHHTFPPQKPFIITDDNKLIVDSSLESLVDDVFILQGKNNPSCRSGKDIVSRVISIHIHIKLSNEMLHFVHDTYQGTVNADAWYGTLVSGIQELYACSFTAKWRCPKNLDYKIFGSQHFFLDTVYRDSQIQVQILTKESFKYTIERSFSFVISATSAEGFTGYATVRIDKDTVLRYHPGVQTNRQSVPDRQYIRRLRREVPGQEVLPTDTIQETAAGYVFTVRNRSDPVSWRYVLKSSSLENAFRVSNDGNVSVIGKLDYEYMRAEDLNTTVKLIFEVFDTNGIVRKEVVKYVTIVDVNDEMPIFTNKPSPYFATVSPLAVANTLVYTITAADPDANSNVTVSGTVITGSQSYFRLQIGTNTIAIYTTGTPMQQDTEHTVQVMATDNNAEMPQTQRVTADVKIMAGERNPQFFQESYHVLFQEANAVDQIITPNPIEVISFQRNSVAFTVLDLQNPDSTLFRTRATTFSGNNVRGCQIIATQVMDYETEPRSFNLRIIATEEQTQRTSSVSLTIELTDKNEFAPRFSVSTYKQEQLREDIAIGSSILQVTATDQDYNTKITFSVDDDHFYVNSTAPNNTFGPYIGVVYVAQHLDFDRRTPPLYDFSVIATDNGNIKKSGNATVRIFMQNINDEHPTFPENMTANLRFDAAVGSEVFLVKASDLDAGDTITYAFAQVYSTFEIDPSTGRITLKQKIADNQDSIRQFQYILRVIATDDGGCCPGTNASRLQTEGNVTVNIVTDNKYRPVFVQCEQYAPKVKEEAANAVVITVSATDNDAGINSKITYSLRSADSQFRIDPANGTLFTRQGIDRESLRATTTVPVNVLATDGGGLQGTCVLLVVIEDINDNPPIFVETSYTFLKLNTIPVGGKVEVVQARDADIGKNAEIQYSMITNPGQYFSIEQFTGLIRVNKTLPVDGSLKTVALVVKAQDSSPEEVRSSSVSVTINLVSDSTLLPPEWQGGESDYDKTVNETIGKGEDIMIVSAMSRVVGDGTLSFIVLSDPADKGIFTSITSTSGGTWYMALRRNISLDYETKTRYTITLRATDIKNKQTDRQAIINVLDMNDNEPYFLGRNPDSNWLELEVAEGDYQQTTENPGKVISQLQARDNDGTFPNNQIKEFRILTNTTKFLINSTSGLLYTRSSFDRETNDVYSIEVQVTDGAPSALRSDNQPNTGKVIVRITITDVNDNPPKFTQDVYVFNAREDLLVGSVVNKTEATDPDSAAVLSYSQTSDSSIPFSIQSQTGEIKVAGPLDYDLGVKMYRFQVIVSDSNFTNTASVTINLIDVNDNPPAVADVWFQNFTENDPNTVGVFYTVTATDIDFGGSNTFYYALKFAPQSDEQYFEISRTSGEVRIKKPLDRDYPNGSPNFVLTVEVADGDPSSSTDAVLFGYGTITVSPIDVNDNAPQVLPEDRQLSVYENEDPDTLVGRIKVVDYDIGVNAEVDVTIFGQSPRTVFKLNKVDLYTTTSLDREDINKYYVTITMTDRGTPKQSSTATLTISVLDKNDNSPKFNSSFHFLLPETQTQGEIGRIRAYDADEGINAQLTYSLETKDTEYFEMRQSLIQNGGFATEGILRIFREINFDAGQTSFNLTVYAVDSNPGPNNENRASTFIEIEVIDYNDETPIFSQPEQSVTVAEDANPGLVLKTFNATDKDVKPEYSRISYFIAQKTDPLEQFSIDQDGVVRLKNRLDYETLKVHKVHILAIDNPNGLPQKTGTATLTVTVTDINDNYPDFANMTLKPVEENREYNNNLLQTFSAVDRDGPDNGPPFSFELRCTAQGASSQCGKFSLNPVYGTIDRGEIYVTGSFDREFEKVINLPFYMCDHRGMSNQQCGYRYLGINVVDKNDNLHSNGHQEILVYNYKGLFGDIEIGKVNPNDPDDDDTDKIFQLQNSEVASYYVSINSQSGAITLKRGVPETSFEIVVTVTDQQRNVRQSTVRIQVVYITEDAVYNSGSVRIKGITPEDFLLKPKRPGAANQFGDSMYDSFRLTLANQLYAGRGVQNLENVQVLSVMSVQDGIDVRFSAHGSPWYSTSRMDGVVSENRDEFSKILYTPGASGNGTIDMIPVDMCQFENCEGGCFNELVVKDTPVLINTKGSSFVGVNTMVMGTCGCQAKNFSDPIGCKPGYCYHGGTCEKDAWGVVSCHCPEGFDGPRCQVLRQSFDGTGYALYRQLEQCEQSRTSIEVLTTKADSLVMYNGPVSELQPGDPKDFLLLELVGGIPKLRVNQGTGELTLTSSTLTKVNDGAWHRIDIVRDKKSIKLLIDNCVKSQIVGGQEDRSNCEVSGITPGENFYINVASLLHLGGRATSPSYPANVGASRFVGCMRSLKHNAQLYDLSTGGQFTGAQDGCPREDESCGKVKCEHGHCEILGVNIAACTCDAGYRPSTSQVCDTATTQRLLQTSSYMSWNLKQSFQSLLSNKETIITFHVRTRDEDGLIFHTRDASSDNIYITLRIVAKKLQLSFNLGDGVVDLMLNNVEASNGQWHKVMIQRFGKDFFLMMDGGEGRYYAEAVGPVVNNKVTFTPGNKEIVAGGSVSYTTGSPVFNGEDFQDSCMNDIRFARGWFPMSPNEDTASPAATIAQLINTNNTCQKNDCPPNRCPEGQICVPLWGTFICNCPEHYNKSGAICVPFDYCKISPCFGGATCTNNVPPAKEDDQPFICSCPGIWYGNLCQCHPSLNPAGGVCSVPTESEESVAAANGMIIGIVLGLLFLIVAIIVIAIYLCRRTRPSQELLDEDLDDDIRENVMYYDEEGAGEEDMTRYDLSRLRKPDDGEHPSTWDAPDIRKKSTKPLGASGDRPDIGDFIDNRLHDADDDPNSPPFDTPFTFNEEGGGSDAGSLSSLNTSSSGDQDYDYLNEWGPKFAKLADIYNSNNYDEDDL